jgi:hypothetical protein
MQLRLLLLLLCCARWAAAQFFQFQQGGINLEDLMGGGGFGGFGGGGGGGYEELPQEEEEEEVSPRWRLPHRSCQANGQHTHPASHMPPRTSQHAHRAPLPPIPWVIIELDGARAQVDLYERLGLQPEASNREIKSAYRKLSVQYHPDKNQGNEQALVRALPPSAELGTPAARPCTPPRRAWRTLESRRRC